MTLLIAQGTEQVIEKWDKKIASILTRSRCNNDGEVFVIPFSIIEFLICAWYLSRRGISEICLRDNASWDVTFFNEVDWFYFY